MRLHAAPAALLALALAAVAVGAAVASALGSCQPGTYEYNQSGLFVCLPAVPGNLTFSDLAWSASYVNDTVVVTGASFNRTHTLWVGVYSPSGALLWNTTIEATPGEPFNVSGRVGVYDYVVLNASIDGYEWPAYALPRAEPNAGAASLGGEVPEGVPRGLVSLLLALAAGAPVLAVVLRGNPRDIGLGLVALSVFVVPWMLYWGAPPLAAGLVAGLIAVIGILAAAAG